MLTALVEFGTSQHFNPGCGGKKKKMFTLGGKKKKMFTFRGKKKKMFTVNPWIDKL